MFSSLLAVNPLLNYKITKPLKEMELINYIDSGFDPNNPTAPLHPSTYYSAYITYELRYAQKFSGDQDYYELGASVVPVISAGTDYYIDLWITPQDSAHYTESDYNINSSYYTIIMGSDQTIIKEVFPGSLSSIKITKIFFINPKSSPTYSTILNKTNNIIVNPTNSIQLSNYTQYNDFEIHYPEGINSYSFIVQDSTSAELKNKPSKLYKILGTNKYVGEFNFQRYEGVINTSKHCIVTPQENSFLLTVIPVTNLEFIHRLQDNTYILLADGFIQTWDGINTPVKKLVDYETYKPIQAAGILPSSNNPTIVVAVGYTDYSSPDYSYKLEFYSTNDAGDTWNHESKYDAISDSIPYIFCSPNRTWLIYNGYKVFNSTKSYTLECGSSDFHNLRACYFYYTTHSLIYIYDLYHITGTDSLNSDSVYNFTPGYSDSVYTYIRNGFVYTWYLNNTTHTLQCIPIEIGAFASYHYLSPNTISLSQDAFIGNNDNTSEYFNEISIGYESSNSNLFIKADTYTSTTNYNDYYTVELDSVNIYSHSKAFPKYSPFRMPFPIPSTQCAIFHNKEVN